MPLFYCCGNLLYAPVGSGSYTLQGWLKGANSPLKDGVRPIWRTETLLATRDMGQDGNNISGNPNALFARDAFGYSLNYFTG